MSESLLELLLLLLLLLLVSDESEEEEYFLCRPAFRPDPMSANRYDTPGEEVGDGGGVGRNPHDGQMDFSSGRFERTRIHRQ
jgi:hypothetical protein